MIGYYIHHQGRGHVHRAEALAARLDEPVTALSSLPRPRSWRGPWITLPRDDRDLAPRDVTAGNQLHWVPAGDAGLRTRMAMLSRWIDEAAPRAVVVDVSVEVALLVRLHGVPVVSVVLPGRRVDPAHLLGFRASTALVAMWPAGFPGMTPDLPADVLERISCVGTVSRFPVAATPSRAGRRRVVVLQGQGGGALTTSGAEELGRATPGWDWQLLGPGGTWMDDPSPLLRSAGVVVTQAGQGSLADVAACRRPALVVPAERPYDEQATTADVLARSGLPVVVRRELPGGGWPELLAHTAALDGAGWSRWHDGRAGERFAEVLRTLDAADRSHVA